MQLFHSHLTCVTGTRWVHDVSQIPDAAGDLDVLPLWPRHVGTTRCNHTTRFEELGTVGLRPLGPTVVGEDRWAHFLFHYSALSCPNFAA